MACGCRKNKSNDQRVTKSYQVWLNDVYAGRTFTSFMQAKSYANKIGGEVREV